ncbi:LysR family transcriptional regulator, partial [Escherichia coli]|uniref:LysR family transcriptional regulator n=1 Tax=Escherichia coli TaxID=562 RepID=UPI000BD7C76D
MTGITIFYGDNIILYVVNTKELGLTQPAVSKIINDIEDYFGVELVVRKNTG